MSSKHTAAAGPSSRGATLRGAPADSGSGGENGDGLRVPEVPVPIFTGAGPDGRPRRRNPPAPPRRSGCARESRRGPEPNARGLPGSTPATPSPASVGAPAVAGPRPSNRGPCSAPDPLDRSDHRGRARDAPRHRRPRRRRAPTSPRRWAGTPRPRRDPGSPRAEPPPIGRTPIGPDPSAPPPSRHRTGHVVSREPTSLRGRHAGRGGASGAWAAAGTRSPRRSTTATATPIAAAMPTPESGLRADAWTHRDSPTRPSPRRASPQPIRRAEPHPEPGQDPLPLPRPVEGALLTPKAMRAVRRGRDASRDRTRGIASPLACGQLDDSADTD